MSESQVKKEKNRPQNAQKPKKNKAIQKNDKKFAKSIDKAQTMW